MHAIQYQDSTKKFHRPGTLRLTRYEFACGYVQQVESQGCTISNGIQLRIWMEHSTFHVRAHNFSTGERIFWESFDTMTEANRRFFRAMHELNLPNPYQEVR